MITQIRTLTCLSNSRIKEMKKKNIPKLYQNNLLLTTYRLLSQYVLFSYLNFNEFDVNALIKHSTWKRTAWQIVETPYVCVLCIYVRCFVYAVRKNRIIFTLTKRIFCRYRNTFKEKYRSIRFHCWR